MLRSASARSALVQGINKELAVLEVAGYFERAGAFAGG